jgi:serine/threonine protein kinase
MPEAGEYVGYQLGEYVVTAHVGPSLFGDVYRARRTKTGDEYELKVLPPGLSQREGFFEAFCELARRVLGLKHMSLAATFYMGRAQEVCFTVTERVVGPFGKRTTLDEHLGQLPGGRAPEEQARIWAMQLLSALTHVHHGGLVHGSVRPECVLVNKAGTAKLTDCGLLELVGPDALVGAGLDGGASPAPGGALSRAMALCEYVAPELAQPGATSTPQSDLYAFGILIYRILTGKEPSRFAEFPSDLIPGLPTAWDSIVLHAATGKTDARFASAERLLEAVANLRGEPAVAGAGAAQPAGSTAAAVVPPTEASEAYTHLLSEMQAGRSEAAAEPPDEHVAVTVKTYMASDDAARMKLQRTARQRTRTKVALIAAFVGISVNVILGLILWPNKEAIRTWLIRLLGGGTGG